jgi:hypothetical protein
MSKPDRLIIEGRYGHNAIIAPVDSTGEIGGMRIAAGAYGSLHPPETEWGISETNKYMVEFLDYLKSIGFTRTEEIKEDTSE